MSEQQTEAQAGKPEFKPPATQADLDRIIAERLNRECAKYADYQDLRKKAEQFDQLQESQKTELEKAIGRAETPNKLLPSSSNRFNSGCGLEAAGRERTRRAS